MDSFTQLWPDTLPAPLLSRRRQTSSLSQLTVMETGRVRVRRLSLLPLITIQFQWNFTEDEFATFKTFFDETLNNGAYSFLLDGVEYAFMERGYFLASTDNQVSVMAVVEQFPAEIVEDSSAAPPDSSSPFFSSSAPDPAPPLTDLILWLKADQIGLPNGSLIAQWDDQSGHNNHATMGAGNPDNRPKILINRIGGLPTVSFDHPIEAPYLEIPNFHHYNVSGAEIFAVLKAKTDPNPDATLTAVWSFGGSITAANEAYGYLGNVSTSFATTIPKSNIPVGPSLIPARVYSIASEAAWGLSNDHRVWLDGALINSSDINDQFNLFYADLYTHRLASSYSGTSRWKGEIAEVLIWGKQLSNAERQQAIDYLANKYALSVSNISFTRAPSDFPSLWGHWKADSLALSDGDKVEGWEDQSGNGRDFGQLIGFYQPVYKANIVGSMPAVYFNGVTYMDMPAWGIPLSGPFTVIVVMRPSGSQCIVFGHDTTNYQITSNRGGSGNNRLSFYANSPGNEVYNTTDFFWFGTVPQMNVWRRDSSVPGNMKLSQNKTENTNKSTFGHNGAATFNQIGRNITTSSMAAHVCEICIYETELLDVDIWYLYDTYFKPRWSSSTPWQGLP